MDVRGWEDQKGKTFRIGYYRKQDGLDCVWLVNADAEYEQTTDQLSIQTEFDVLELSDETDFFGVDRTIIEVFRQCASSVG
jgi:hypothetical protein